MYAKMTVECFKSPAFLSDTLLYFIRSYQKVGVSETHVQNFGGVLTSSTVRVFQVTMYVSLYHVGEHAELAVSPGQRRISRRIDWHASAHRCTADIYSRTPSQRRGISATQLHRPGTEGDPGG